MAKLMAKPKKTWYYRLAEDREARAVDGDTLDLWLDMGCDVVHRVRRFRLLGVNAPELRIPREKAAALVVQSFVQEWIEKYRETCLILSFGYDKYGGLEGDVQISDFALCKTLLVDLLGLGFVKSWDGKGEKPPWSEEELVGIESFAESRFLAELELLG